MQGNFFFFLKKKRKEKLEAGFLTRVSIGMHYKTIYGLNDGVEGRTGACREYSLPREEPDSELFRWIGGHTKICPLLQVKICRCFDQYGIEIQVPSTSRDGSTSWIVISSAQTATWRSYHVMIEIALQKVMN